MAHILAQNPYCNYYYPKPKYLLLGYLDPLGIMLLSRWGPPYGYRLPNEIVKALAYGWESHYPEGPSTQISGFQIPETSQISQFGT